MKTNIKANVCEPILTEGNICVDDRGEVAYQRAKVYTWKRCAQQTFDFLNQIANDRKH